MQKAQSRVLFMDGPFVYNLIGEGPVNPARKNNIHCHQIKAKSARQRERRIEVTTGESQGRFVFQI